MRKNNNEQQNIDSHSNSVKKAPRNETTLLVNSRTPVLLQTAVIDILAPNTGQITKIWAFFDSGSQGSYISKRKYKQLSLQTKGPMNVNICVFDCENTKSEIHDSLEIYLQTKNEDKVLIKALIKQHFYTT